MGASGVSAPVAAPEAAQREIDDLKAMLANITKAHEAAISELGKLREQLAEAKSEREKLVGELEDVGDERDALVARVEEFELEKATYDEDLARELARCRSLFKDGHLAAGLSDFDIFLDRNVENWRMYA